MTIKLLHTSDSHWREDRRLDDVTAVHDAMLAIAEAEHIDAFVHGGDWFDKRSTPTERTALASWLRRAADIAPVWGCKGNHDVAGDLEIFNRLETERLVWIEERSTAAPGSARILRLSDGRRIGMMAMAWVDKANVVAQLPGEFDQEASRQYGIAAVRDLLSLLRAEATRLRAAGAVPVLATHVMLGGSVVSTGQVLIGQGLELSPSDLLDVGAAYVACGHIHAHQSFLGGRVAYSGSPVRHDFGENEPKGCYLVTLSDSGELLEHEFRELPARRMVRIEADLTSEPFPGDGYVPGFDASAVQGALVRFRYHIRARDLHRVNARALEMLLRQAGAVEVQMEAVVEHETRVRSELISTATTTAEKVDAWLAAKSIQVDEPTLERLHSKLGELEGSHAL